MGNMGEIHQNVGENMGNMGNMGIMGNMGEMGGLYTSNDACLQNNVLRSEKYQLCNVII